MAELTSLEVEFEPGCARVTLARPDSGNALTPRLLEELVAVCGELEAREDLRVVVLRGAGRGFSAGMDLSRMAGLFARGLPSEEQLLELAELGRRAVDAVLGLSAVTVAELRGFAVGGGFLLAAACDLRVVAEGTRFALPEVDLGVPLTWGGVPLLCRVLGPSLARDLVLTGRRVGPDALSGLGFAVACVPAASLEERCASLVASLLAKPSGTPRSLKAQFQRQLDVRDDGIDDEQRFVRAVRSPTFFKRAMTYVRGRQEEAGEDGGSG